MEEDCITEEEVEVDDSAGEDESAGDVACEGGMRLDADSAADGGGGAGTATEGREGGGRTGETEVDGLPSFLLGLVLLLPPRLREAGTVPLPIRKLLVGALTAGAMRDAGGGFTGTAVSRDGGRGGAGEALRGEEATAGDEARFAAAEPMAVGRELEEERERGAESRRTAL